MINENTNAMGILFPNSYDKVVPELVSERLMASIPLASRYRLVDFILSSMVNSGIDNISVLVRENYLSLLDHLGSGREWDLTRKNGGLNIVPPFAERNTKIYNGRVDAVASILNFLRRQKEKYVIMADTNIALNFDFNKLLETHIASGADVTVMYAEQEIPENLRVKEVWERGLYYTFELDGTRIKHIHINSQKEGIQNYSMNVYCMGREALIEEIHNAFVHGLTYFERDVLSPQLDKLNVQAYRYDGYFARITGMKSYFDENMKLLQDENLDGLFAGNPIYTKIRDDNPTRYIEGAAAKNVMIADGCIIEGEVENSILFRGVKVAKGAKVKNSILMQDTVVEEGAVCNYLITDKAVTISKDKEMKGTESFPIFVPKQHTV